ncbi:MAG TPA: permease [Ktedonobacterales bacterium]|nr:permease [Ktedonobacterales bacterium]
MLACIVTKRKWPTIGTIASASFLRSLVSCERATTQGEPDCPDLRRRLFLTFGAEGLVVATGALVVIPTAGEIPIIQMLLAFGLSAGGADALLLTLARLSLPSRVMMSRVFRRRALVGLFALTVLGGIFAGVVALTRGL